jgi:hypothetical protein
MSSYNRCSDPGSREFDLSAGPPKIDTVWAGEAPDGLFQGANWQRAIQSAGAFAFTMIKTFDS